MTFASSFCKKGHCIHILWCIFMGLGHNDPWVESHIRPQQMWGQRSSRGQWPLVQVFAKTVTVFTYFDVCSGETCGSRTTCMWYIFLHVWVHDRFKLNPVIFNWALFRVILQESLSFLLSYHCIVFLYECMGNSPTRQGKENILI